MKRWIHASLDLKDPTFWDQFDDVADEYLPDQGEGDTAAEQAVTALNKLVYRFYNDGDVYDNSGYLESYNDLSDEANWLYKNIPGVRQIMERVWDADRNEYERILTDLAENILGDRELLYGLDQEGKKGTIYDCDGPFIYMEPLDDDEWDEDDDWDAEDY